MKKLGTDIQKNTARLLAILLLLMSFTSCTAVDSSKKTNTSSDTAAAATSDELSDNLPDKDFGGETFSVYLAHPVGNITSDELNGDILNDAVYERNLEIENRFNVKLEFNGTYGSSGSEQALATAYIKSLILAGDDTYDMIIHVQHTGMPALIYEKMFINWNDIDYIDMSKPWWYGNIARDINFGTKIYTMCGSYNLQILSTTECLMFNKRLLDDLNIEYPYQKVLDYQWTHDVFKEMITAGSADLNGDGKLNIADDRYGFAGWQYEMLPAMYVGYGGQILVKDEKNLPVLNINNESSYKIFDKILELTNSESVFYHGTTYGLEDTMFKERRLLFNDAFLSSLTSFRDMEDDFGFVPYPMLDEKQNAYYSRTANVAGLSYIPITNKDLEKTGIILEAMSCLSYKTVVPTFFDIVLTVKTSRDTESEQMVPIIRESGRFIEAAISFSPSNIITSKKNTVASDYASNEGKYKKELQDIIDTYS